MHTILVRIFQNWLCALLVRKEVDFSAIELFTWSEVRTRMSEIREGSEEDPSETKQLAYIPQWVSDMLKVISSLTDLFTMIFFKSGITA